MRDADNISFYVNTPCREKLSELLREDMVSGDLGGTREQLSSDLRCPDRR